MNLCESTGITDLIVLLYVRLLLFGEQRDQAMDSSESRNWELVFSLRSLPEMLKDDEIQET